MKYEKLNINNAEINSLVILDIQLMRLLDEDYKNLSWYKIKDRNKTSVILENCFKNRDKEHEISGFSFHNYYRIIIDDAELTMLALHGLDFKL